MLKKTIYENVILGVDATFDDGKKLKGSIAFVTKDYNIKIPEDENKQEHILAKEEFTVEVKDSKAEYRFIIKELIEKHNINQKDIAYVKGWMDSDGDDKYNRLYDLEVFLEVCMGITKEMLSAMGCVNIPNETELIEALNKYCCQYEINTPLRVAHFLSQAAHESGGFTVFKEGVNYKHNGAKIKLNKYRNYIKELIVKYGSEANAMNHNRFFPNKQIISKQPDLFNFAYANDNGNGDEKSGDGFKYRGRGIIQITGREKYQGFTNEHNKKNPNDIQDFVDNPDLVADNVNYRVASACWYWRNKGALYGKFNAKGDINILIDNAPYDVKLVSQAVNGGVYGKSNGYDEPNEPLSRLPLFNKLKEYLEKKGLL